MDLSYSLMIALWQPSYVRMYDKLKKQIKVSDESVPPTSWESSQLNPKNRIDSLDGAALRWRVDGATACGRQFFVVPTSLLPELRPLRIDLYIPEQDEHPPSLRDVLESSRSIVSRDSAAVAALGIAQHVCHALDSFCSLHPEFLESYHEFPFGTRLSFKNISADVSEMELSVLPSYDSERKSLAVYQLRSVLFRTEPASEWPQTIKIERLRFIQQLHDSVSIVQLVDDLGTPGDVAIVKSSTEDFRRLYHELDLLLTFPPHPNIMERPTHIVTKRSSFGGKYGVVGFILPYHPLGSIRDILPTRHRNGCLPFRTRLNWCRQVTSALLHLNERCGTFYSDLRPDNVLLSSHHLEGGSCVPAHEEEAIVLCDFEQRGNWYEWCAPEVLFRQYTSNLRTSMPILDIPDQWSDLIEQYNLCAPQTEDGSQSSIRDYVQSRNLPWFCLSTESREKAQVYSLGLFIYCVFEGLSNVRNNILNAYSWEPGVEFPVFKATPPLIQQIVRRCTVDAPEWREAGLSSSESPLLPPRAPRVVRRGFKLYAQRQVSGFQSLCKAKEVLDAGWLWWTTELERARMFLRTDEWRTQKFGKDRPTLRDVLDMLERSQGG